MSQREVEVLDPNVHVDVCPDCKGMWFDDGELRKVLRDRRVGDRLAPVADGREGSSLVCPRCGSAMDLRQEEDVVVGRWRGQAPDIDGVVLLDGGEAGDIVPVAITDAFGYDLEGELVP